MHFYLGVDAGGSKTNVLITDDQGFIRGAGSSGNGNYQLGKDCAERNIKEAVFAALSEAELSVADISFAFFGLAGADREADYQILRPIIGNLGFSKYEIVCDTMIAMRAGTLHPYGVVLICGTGINCGGRSPQGEESQIGGFGYMYGDHGGGADLAIEAFRSVVRAWEGREPKTALTEKMLSMFDYSSVEEMYNGFIDENRTSVPLRIVPHLFELADLGDDTTRKILHRQGVELGITAQAMIRRLGMESLAFDVVLAGSVVAKGKGTFITDPIEQAVREIAPHATVKRLQVEPVVGAVMRAMDEAGLIIPAATFARLQEIHSLKELRLSK